MATDIKDVNKPGFVELVKTFLLRVVNSRPLRPFKNGFLLFDKKVDGAILFFVKNYGKTKFMIAMSKRVQVLGIEKVWNKGPKAFIYFFLFYLIRDTILYIIIPIWIAKATSAS